MNKLWTMTALAALLVVGAVTPAGAVDAGAPDSGLESKQVTDVFAFADVPDLVDLGDASLRRTDDGISGKIEITDVDPGGYTMWWVVWNTPEGCAEPFQCAEGDLFNPEAGLAIGFAGGGIVDQAGDPFRVKGDLEVGTALEGFPYPEFSAAGLALTETTLVDSRHAEIHLVVRSHGPAVSGMEASAKRTFNGACRYDPPLDVTAPAYGTPGPNTCVDSHFAVFASESAS